MSERGEVNIKMILGIAVLMIIVATGTSYLFMRLLLDSGETGIETIEKFGHTHSLGDFVVNLSDMRTYHLMRTNIVVEISDERMIADLQERDPQIRDSIIVILRSQARENVEQPGAEKIKEQIKKSINEIFQRELIKNVWFTELVVQ